MSDINSKVFNSSKTDYNKVSLLLGDQDVGLFDTVNKQYPEIWKLYKAQKSQDWDENEFDYSSCNVEFKSCSKSQYDMMIRTLAWQWEADSVASRAIAPILAPFISSSELWAAWLKVTEIECLTPDHEVLTPTGWKSIATVTKEDKVAQWDEGVASFVHPTNTIKKAFSGQVYSFKNTQNHMNQVVTPNHRLVKVDKRSGEKVVGLAETFDYDLGATSGSFHCPVSGVLVGEHTTLTPLEQFYIAAQADGGVSERYTGERCGSIPVWFGFAKDRKVKRLFEICSAANLPIRELSGEERGSGRNPLRKFKVDVPLDLCVDFKNFSWVDLSDKGSGWCEAFIEELLLWDGTMNKTCISLSTTNKKVAEVSQMVGVLGGLKTHFRVGEDNRKETFSDVYTVTFKRNAHVSGQVIKKTSFNYEGDVYCLTVPSSFFFVRREGAVSVTGNCLHSATYSEIVRCSFDNPEEVLGEILKVTESFGRLEVVADVFSKAYTTSHKYALGQVGNDQETYNDAFMFIVALLALERIQFMSSFAVTFAICDTGLFQPIGKAIQKIAQDELEIHVALDKAVLKHEMTTERGKVAFQQNKDLIKHLIDEVVDSELAWTDYLFSEGRELVGLNPDYVKKWALFNAKDVYGLFGIESKHPLPRTNPLKFMENWLDISKTQPAPQEQDIGQYRVGIMRRDDEGEAFDADF